MTTPSQPAAPSQAVLLDIIRIQTEIAQLGHDLGQVMHHVCRQSQALTRATGAVIELAEGHEMVYRAASGSAEIQLGLRLNRIGSLSGMSVQTNRIMVCADSETDSRVNRQACRLVGLRSMVVVPLRHEDTTVGVLKVMSAEPNAFTDDDVQILALLSNLVAAAMYHASKMQTNELYFRATHDALTGLPNRALFFDRLRQSLAHAERQGERLALLNIDMDGLKPINDGFGHRAGDAAIREVAVRIASCVRQADMAARLSGDEFAVMLTSVRDLESAMAQAARIDRAIKAPFSFEGHHPDLSASIGVSLFPDDAQEIAGLVEAADSAMYREKKARKTLRA